MIYENIVQGTFLERPNRFIAHVEINGKMEVCHVKNTGRCKELLIPGVRVYLEENNNPQRKTRFSLISVMKDERLINMDSQVPNKVVYEWLVAGHLFPKATLIKPEAKYGNSRFDFYVEEEDRKIFIEVKGVTLEEDNIVLFPDAPTLRGVKHLNELCLAKENGYEAYVIFVIQMENVDYFTPNIKTHKLFGDTLAKAEKSGVHILAYDCQVGIDSLGLNQPVKVNLFPQEEENLLSLMGQPLLKWYDEHARILPWREEATPYRIWISEIMLQQTRVEAVKPYFQRFIEGIPDVFSLAKIPEEDLLKYWEGLGYYNRARNLQKAAQIIVEEYGGEFPSTYEELLNLPGIGSYTAGAVASIGFKQPVPAVDGNVLRVISRITASYEDILSQKTKQKTEKAILEIMPLHRPGDFNQGLMEIGAMVCVPKGIPKCEECPFETFCQAKAKNIIMELPKKTPKKPRVIEQKTVFILKYGDKVALRKRVEKGLLQGMYEFPNVEGHLSEEEALNRIKEMSFLPIRIQQLENAKHIFSHREWDMIGYAIRIDELMDKDQLEEEYVFIEVQETKDKYPIPTAFSAYAHYMNINLGNERFEL